MTTHGDDGSMIEDVRLRQEGGNYGVDIPKNVWHIDLFGERMGMCRVGH